jgi:hypothetical protein
MIRDDPGSKTLSRTATVQHGPSRTSPAPLRMTPDPTRRRHGPPRTTPDQAIVPDHPGSFWPPKTSGVESRTTPDPPGPSRTIQDHQGANTDQTPDHPGWGLRWSVLVRDPNGTGALGRKKAKGGLAWQHIDSFMRFADLSLCRL